MGTAWGPQCEYCPRRGSAEYDELCLEAGYSIDGTGKKNSFIFLFTAHIIKSLFRFVNGIIRRQKKKP